MFCTYCGLEMIDHYIFERYNSQNGEKLFKKYKICPNRFFGQFSILFFHDMVPIIDVSFGTVQLLVPEHLIKKKG